MEYGTLSPETDGQVDGIKEIDAGRRILGEWEASQPSNFFTTDLNFQRTLEYHWGTGAYRRHASRLYRFGEVLATKVDPLIREANRDENLPRLERFDPWGDPQEDVIFHPAHHEAGKHIYSSGAMEVYKEQGANLIALSLFYLSAQNGEAGHNCPLACTAGLIKALQALGTPEQQDRYLPSLLNPDYDQLYHGAQFLTEVQGGSDVGANGTRAIPGESDGLWYLSGEKWFCSNVTADLALVTARVPEQGEGTRGLGLFLMPRYLEDGSLNSFTILRLKEKLGTRSLATAEMSLDGAEAYQLGPTRNGFKNVMTYVINTSRIYNALGVCGNARRAYSVASTYASHRSAFGRAILHYPIVQDILANIRADSTAVLSGSLRIARVMDDLEMSGKEISADGFLRMAINLNKYRSAVIAQRCIISAIELLGGNGAVETFSILPRLLRDNIVYENWEGTHNVLLAQLQRDMRRYGIHEPFFQTISGLIEERVGDFPLDEMTGLLDQQRAEVNEVLAMDELTASIYFRPLMDRVADLYYAACMLHEAGWELREKTDRTKLRLVHLFFQRRAAGREPKDIAYYDDLVSRLCL